MSTTAQIEDAIIQALKGLGLFKKVGSAGRDEIPQTLAYPSAYAFFDGDIDSSVPPRPVVDSEFNVVVVNRNLRSEEKAAEDTYALLDAVRDAFNGKRLGLADIMPCKVKERRLMSYESGVITYSVKIGTQQVLPVPSTD